MADKKISQLTGATTPLAGTEEVLIVQSGATVKVASDNLTVKNVRSNATSGILQVAGPAAASTRIMTVPDANFTAARTDAAQTFTGIQTFASAPNLDSLTASTALALDASKNVVSVTNTGTGNNVLATSPTLTTPKGVQGSLTLGPGSGADFKSGGTFMAFATFPVAVTITGIDFQYIQANQDNVLEIFQYQVAGSGAVTLATYTGTAAGTRTLRTTGLTVAVAAGTRFFVGPNTSSNNNQSNVNVAIEYTTA